MNTDSSQLRTGWWLPQGLQPLDQLVEEMRPLRQSGKTIVTTNGCFDLLHPGHLTFLEQARGCGDVLIAAINSDRGVRLLKGDGRPYLDQNSRARLLAGLRAVDYVVIFDELLPNQILQVLQPDIHCKAGDYQIEHLPEAEIVRSRGGTVRILPLNGSFSTSRLVHQIVESGKHRISDDESAAPANGFDLIAAELFEGSNLLRQTAYRLNKKIWLCAELMIHTLRGGHKILVCGNGGSAADAQHLAAELVGRFRRDRAPWPALSLTTDPSTVTSLSNDYGFEQVFARQVLAYGQPGDLLVAISTSGNSPNVITAARTARKIGLSVIGLCGDFPDSHLTKLADPCLDIPSRNTALIQQAHTAVIHLFCELVEKALSGVEEGPARKIPYQED